MNGNLTKDITVGFWAKLGHNCSSEWHPSFLKAGMSLNTHQRQDKQKGELDSVIGQSSDSLQLHRVFRGLLTPSGHLNHILSIALSLQTELLVYYVISLIQWLLKSQTIPFQESDYINTTQRPFLLVPF